MRILTNRPIKNRGKSPNQMVLVLTLLSTSLFLHSPLRSAISVRYRTFHFVETIDLCRGPTDCSINPKRSLLGTSNISISTTLEPDAGREANGVYIDQDTESFDILDLNTYDYFYWSILIGLLLICNGTSVCIGWFLHYCWTKGMVYDPNESMINIKAPVTTEARQSFSFQHSPLRSGRSYPASQTRSPLNQSYISHEARGVNKRAKGGVSPRSESDTGGSMNVQSGNSIVSTPPMATKVPPNPCCR